MHFMRSDEIEHYGQAKNFILYGARRRNGYNEVIFVC